MKGQKDYTQDDIIQERKEGFFWYDSLWRVLRPLLIGLCSLMVVAGIILHVYQKIKTDYFSPMDASDSSPVLFQIQSGSSLSKVANQLEAQGLVHNRTVFKYYADFLGYGQKIQAGDYELSKSMSMTEILDTLTTGDGKPIVRTITIIPGWTIEDIADYLVQIGALDTAEEFLSLCKTGIDYNGYYYVADVLATNSSGQRKYVLEGYLAANTYEIYTTATADDIIRKLLSQTGLLFSDDYYTRASELGLTMDQVFTLASMIEKEAVTEDFAKVSAVFHNRLNQKMTLGSDATVKYATGIKRMALTDSDTAVNSPYNTYKNTGLPVGPICAPSPDAIKAALYPEESYMQKGQEYLYFCSREPNNTSLYFSKTYEEHQQAVAYYRASWEEYDKEHGLDD